jgi:predicted MFS family arabinose efflux permease
MMTASRRWTIILIASAILTLSMGLRQSLGIFQPPMRAELGFSASLFGFALAVQSIVWGLSQPLIGSLGDRFGARPMVMGCAAVYAFGLFLVARGESVAGLEMGAGVLAGIGVSGTGFGVLIGTVSRLVPQERRSQTVGLVSALGSLGTLAVAPLGQYLMSACGWRAALLVCAAIAASMAVLALALDGRRGESESRPQPAGPVLREALTHRGFQLMTLAFFACGFQLMFITAHLPQYLAFCGISPATGAEALGLIGLANAAGSYLFGLAGARFDRRLLLSGIYLGRTIAIAAYVALPVSAASTLIFAGLMGFLWLGVVPLVGSLIGGLFGVRNFNTLFGLTFFSHQVGAFLGAWLGGLAVDLTGSYTAAWTAMILIGLSAALLQWFMDDERDRVLV